MFIDNGYDVFGNPPWIKKQFETHRKFANNISEQTKPNNNVVSYEIESTSYDGTEIVMEYSWYVFSAVEGLIIMKQTGMVTLATTTYKDGAKQLVKQIEQEIIREEANPDYSGEDPYIVNPSSSRITFGAGGSVGS